LGVAVGRIKGVALARGVEDGASVGGGGAVGGVVAIVTGDGTAVAAGMVVGVAVWLAQPVSRESSSKSIQERLSIIVPPKVKLRFQPGS
jgi:outer membrane cobalamin receptor